MSSSCYKISWLLAACLLATFQCQPIPTARPDLQKEYGDALEAIFGMGLRLQAILEDPKTPNDRNFLVSPISAATTIAQLMLGANGEFREQLYYLLSLTENKDDSSALYIYSKKKNSTYPLPHAKLHVQLSNLLRALKTDGDLNKLFTLDQASALFIDEGLKLNQSFEHQLRVLYETSVRPLNFSGDGAGAQKLINDWGSNQTKGLIPSVLSTTPSPSTSAILANAVYFKGDWETPFSSDLNMMVNFTVSAEKKVPVTFMTGFFENIAYAEGPDFNLVGLPYTSGNLVMYILLPQEKNPNVYNIRGFIESLKTKDVLEMISKAKKRDVAVRIPKMALSSSLSLLEPLKKFKVYKKESKQLVTLKNRLNDVVDNLEDKVSAFNNFTANTENTEIELAGAAEGGPLMISGILQQITLSVNEKGTEAAAITASIIDYMGGSKSFKVDRPFAFFIRHEATSAALFWGAIVDPTLS